MPYVLGIDIGSSNTAAAVARRRGATWTRPEAVPLSADSPLMPSVLCLAEDGSLRVGPPADVLALSGSKVRLRGFMIPMDSADRIAQFALVPSLFDCCFGAPPQLQHTVIVNCPPGKAVRYFQQEIEIEGTLKVEEKKEDEDPKKKRGFWSRVFGGRDKKADEDKKKDEPKKKSGG